MGGIFLWAAVSGIQWCASRQGRIVVGCRVIGEVWGDQKPAPKGQATKSRLLSRAATVVGREWEVFQ
jgi:hypothetical protein